VPAFVVFVSISQVIGCEDRLRNDLCCVEPGVKLYSNQPTFVVLGLVGETSAKYDQFCVELEGSKTTTQSSLPVHGSSVADSTLAVDVLLPRLEQRF